MSQSQGSNLTGQCLIAMPDMPDPRFQSSVIYLCSHSDEGAMGLIVNKPSNDARLSDLLDQMSIARGADFEDRALHFGGPVEAGRGFVLHSSDYHSDLSTICVDEGVSMTSTMDVLEEVAGGNGPSRAFFALGYAGWASGQLEAEIAANGWLIVRPTPGLIFETADDAKWSGALALLGIDPAILSGTGGRA